MILTQNSIILRNGIKVYLRTLDQKNQPFYHLFAEKDEICYTAYVSQQNLLPDNSKRPVSHPEVKQNFGNFIGKSYELLKQSLN